MTVTHGLAATYSSGCRCAACRAAATEKQRRYRRGERSKWGRGREPRWLHATRTELAAAFHAMDGLGLSGMPPDSEWCFHDQEAEHLIAVVRRARLTEADR